MTRAEQARMIDRQEFEAESQAIMARALAYSAECRLKAKARIAGIPVEQLRSSGHTQPACTPTTIYTVGDETKSLSEWSIIANVSTATLRQRVNRLGSMEAALKVKGGTPNGRKSKLYSLGDQRMTLQEWADCSGIKYATLHQRIKKGMPIEDAISFKRKSTGKIYTLDGVSKTLQEWAEHSGIRYATLHSRMKDGRTLAEALALEPKKKTHTFEGRIMTLCEWADELGFTSAPALYKRIRKAGSFEAAMQRMAKP